MQALAQNVTVIPARRRVGSQRTAAQVQKTRVAVYCRVSTDSEEQETSYEAQVSHYTEFIQSKPEWQMVEVYADDGISGTNTAKRDEFNRMIADTHQVHQPIFQKYAGLPQVHKKAEGSEHRRFLREGEHQHPGFQGRGASDHHGFPCTTGVGIPVSQRANGHPVPQSARQGADQS